jgi:hypothetical protein
MEWLQKPLEMRAFQNLLSLVCTNIDEALKSKAIREESPDLEVVRAERSDRDTIVTAPSNEGKRASGRRVIAPVVFDGAASETKTSTSGTKVTISLQSMRMKLIHTMGAT